MAYRARVQTSAKGPSKLLKPTQSSKVRKAQKSRPKKKANPKAIKAKTTPRKAQNSQFLDLPPEIRNSIYELVLRKKKPIKVNKHLKAPAIFATCSQIRDEAVGIWYRDNTFTATVYKCDATVLNWWAIHCCTVGQRDFFDVSILLSGNGSWKNLVKWAQAVWKDDRARLMVYEDGMNSYESLVCAAHEIALQSKAKPWAKCLAALEEIKDTSFEVGYNDYYEPDFDDSGDEGDDDDDCEGSTQDEYEDEDN